MTVTKLPLRLEMADVLRIIRAEDKAIDYLWEESDIAVKLSNVKENHRGLEADFQAECPIGYEVQSGIRLYIESLRDRQSIIKALHGLPLDYKEWDKLIEYAFSDVVRSYKKLKDESTNEVPAALTADDILALDTPPTPWLIKDFIVDEGITILASLPKKGKTVLALNMVKAGQSGEKFLQRQVPYLPVLVLALEDTPQRLKTRLSKIGLTGKATTFILECNLTNGFEPLRKLIEVYKPKIIIMDTLLAALQTKDENTTELGIAIQNLHNIAREMHVAFFILHHHGKTKRDDPILDLRGHSSLSGAVDIIMGLYADEAPAHFKLKSASRDGEPLDLDLKYDGGNLKWGIDEQYNENQKAESEVEMINLLSDLGKVSIEAICQANGMTRQRNDNVLKRMLNKGTVKRTPSKVGYQTLYVYELA